MLSEHLEVPWRTFILTEDMLKTGQVYIWFASGEPCYVNSDCIYYEQHRLASIHQPMPGWRSFTTLGIQEMDLRKMYIQVGQIGMAPAAECLPSGFTAWLDPVRVGKVTLSRNRSQFY